MQIEVERRIAASPERVFAVLADIPRWAEAIAAIERVELLSPGPVAVGTRFRETRRMHGKEATEEMWVEELDPPRSMVLGAQSHGTRYRAEHTLTATGDGGTVLRLSFAGVPTALWARLLAPVMGVLVKGSIRRMLAADLDDLARAIEA